MCINPWPTHTLHALCSSGPSHYFRRDAVELEKGPGKGQKGDQRQGDFYTSNEFAGTWKRGH